MTKVQEIKERYDIDALLRAITPAMERNVYIRRAKEQNAKERKTSHSIQKRANKNNIIPFRKGLAL